MTVAIDKRTGKVCGQVLRQYDGVNWSPERGWASGPLLVLLTRRGAGSFGTDRRIVPRDSVRLEEIDDEC